MNNRETDLYLDPPNSDELIAKFKTLTDKKEIRAFIEEIFPGWLVASADSYSCDYQFLQNNWKIICDKTGVSPHKIVIVDKIFFDLKDSVRHNLAMTICERMTRLGYVIRRKEELTGCEICFQAIPAKNLWTFMKQKGLPVPQVWSSKCSSCSRSDSKEVDD